MNRYVRLNENGRIPARKPCPFSSQCGTRRLGDCNHKGTEHECVFSCATARAYDLQRRNEILETAQNIPKEAKEKCLRAMKLFPAVKAIWDVIKGDLIEARDITYLIRGHE